jgi:mono/diheme cytochrome c family protein
MKARVVMLAFLAVAFGSASRLAAQAAGDVKTLYEDNCRKCHGVRGVPPKTMKEKFPKIATFDTAFIAAHSADSIVKVLTKGKNEDMKSFKDKMSADQMMELAKYVRELGSKNHP